VPLVCGNVATGAGARFLRDIGADAVKVGVGPGRGCRTRLETAAGVPQLQAIREAYLAVGDSVPIMADGGVKTDKDIFLALICGGVDGDARQRAVRHRRGAGPRHRGSGDPPEEKDLPRHDLARGRAGNAVRQRQQRRSRPALETPPEGQEIQVPYRGSVSSILQRIRGHLQSSVSYGGEITLAAVRGESAT
jgi:IMP dehydrogenase